MARRPTVLARRIAAIALAVIATAALWFVLFRDGDGSESEDPAQRGGRISAPGAGLVREMSPAERDDQILLVGCVTHITDAPRLR